MWRLPPTALLLACQDRALSTPSPSGWLCLGTWCCRRCRWWQGREAAGLASSLGAPGTHAPRVGVTANQLTNAARRCRCRPEHDVGVEAPPVVNVAVLQALQGNRAGGQVRGKPGGSPTPRLQQSFHQSTGATHTTPTAVTCMQLCTISAMPGASTPSRLREGRQGQALNGKAVSKHDSCCLPRRLPSGLPHHKHTAGTTSQLYRKDN